MTIDSLLPESRIDFLKIDAEGSDYDALEGASRLLERSPDIIVFLEHCSEFYDNPEYKLDWLASLGFSLSHVDYMGDIVPVTAEEVLAQTRRTWNLVLERP